MSLQKIPKDCFQQIVSYLNPEDLYILWRTGSFLKHSWSAQKLDIPPTSWSQSASLSLLRIPNLKTETLEFLDGSWTKLDTSTFPKHPIIVRELIAPIEALYHNLRAFSEISCQILTITVDLNWKPSSVIKVLETISHEVLSFRCKDSYPKKIFEFTLPGNCRELWNVRGDKAKLHWPKTLLKLDLRLLDGGFMPAGPLPTDLPSNLNLFHLHFYADLQDPQELSQIHLPESITDLHLDNYNDRRGPILNLNPLRNLEKLSLKYIQIESFIPKTIRQLSFKSCIIFPQTFGLSAGGVDQVVFLDKMFPHLESFKWEPDQHCLFEAAQTFVFPPSTRTVDITGLRTTINIIGENLKDLNIVFFRQHIPSRFSVPQSVKSLIITKVVGFELIVDYGENLEILKSNIFSKCFVPRGISRLTHLSYVGSTRDSLFEADEKIVQNLETLETPYGLGLPPLKSLKTAKLVLEFSLIQPLPENIEVLEITGTYIVPSIQGFLKYFPKNIRFLRLSGFNDPNLTLPLFPSLETISFQRFSSTRMVIPTRAKKISLTSCTIGSILIIGKKLSITSDRKLPEISYITPEQLMD